VEWLQEQEEELLGGIKLNSTVSVEKAALTSAANCGALKQIGRIKSLPEMVGKVLERWRMKQGLTLS
jgi:hypothetical protein